MTHPYTAAVTLLAVLFYLAVTLNVGRARERYQVKVSIGIGTGPRIGVQKGPP
jgi:hypothetical protein